jgi:hypothetical protein
MFNTAVLSLRNPLKVDSEEEVDYASGIGCRRDRRGSYDGGVLCAEEDRCKVGLIESNVEVRLEANRSLMDENAEGLDAGAALRFRVQVTMTIPGVASDNRRSVGAHLEVLAPPGKLVPPTHALLAPELCAPPKEAGGTSGRIP